MDIAGITIHPGELRMKQIARNVTMEGGGALRDCRYLLHDRDTKYTQSFRTIIASGRVEPCVLFSIEQIGAPDQYFGPTGIRPAHLGSPTRLNSIADGRVHKNLQLVAELITSTTAAPWQSAW